MCAENSSMGTHELVVNKKTKQRERGKNSFFFWLKQTPRLSNNQIVLTHLSFYTTKLFALCPFRF